MDFAAKNREGIVDGNSDAVWGSVTNLETPGTDTDPVIGLSFSCKTDNMKSFERARQTGVTESNPSIWEQIDRCESFLVCSKYEEAALLATSVLRQLSDTSTLNKSFEEDFRLLDMTESAGMVLVQSLKELGRTSQIMHDLKLLYVNIAAIPVQVLLTWACFEISENSAFAVREFLEDFLSKWSYLDGRCNMLVASEASVDDAKTIDGHLFLGVDEYVEVVDFYVVTVLGTVVNNMDLAVSWVDKAALPDESRQELLRRLHSLYCGKATNSTHSSFSLFGAHNHEAHSSLKELNVSEGSPGSPKALRDKCPREKGSKQAILKLSGGLEPCFWWFRTITFKFGNARLVLPNGRIVFACAVLLIIYIFRRKQALMKMKR